MKEVIHKLFVAYKPTGLSSNQFLGHLKRKYNPKKAGYSGTLDPFAKGALIVAFGGHTRLFRFLSKTPKRYRATLWLGAHSDTLDIEAVTQIDTLEPLHVNEIKKAVESLKGSLRYEPPHFCAKKIEGKRAYDLARAGETIKLKPIDSEIYDIHLLHYCHPFVTFETSVSEGTYIRSLGAIISERLGLKAGILTALERLEEGIFRYNDEKALDIKKSLNIPQNYYVGESETLFFGRKLDSADLKITDDGQYWIDCGDTITIIEIQDLKVTYLLNKVEAC
ncbi:MAG: tRNA pseudouridine(55) synthase TruB [Campylobacterota bacterium]|nr:tRNA pseudouridine(55) synthase TruB [Campylobacterota bacterium]